VYGCSRRDAAHRKVKQMFAKTVEKRRESGRREDDLMQTFIDSKYKYGKQAF